MCWCSCSWMPLLMMAVMKPLFALSLQAEGFAGASGAEQAVPGMAAMFATFSASFAGFGFFREHGWGTWDRLRASSATTSDIMVGKLGPVFFISIAQLIGLFGIGILLLDLAIAGSVTALGFIIVAFSMSMIAFGMAITAISRTSLQLNMFANLGGIVFAGVGGALVPVTVLPEWVQTIAQFIPTYWAMQGFLGVILEGDRLADVPRARGCVAGIHSSVRRCRCVQVQIRRNPDLLRLSGDPPLPHPRHRNPRGLVQALAFALYRSSPEGKESEMSRRLSRLILVGTVIWLLIA